MSIDEHSPISAFRGPYRFLSNFYPPPSPVYLDGVAYTTVEHAYQAAKTLDTQWREWIRHSTSPGQAKRTGRKAPKRDNWDAIKVPVMEDLVQQKFEQPEMARQLLATGDAILIEGNYWGDTFWGICDGAGANMLGRILMEVREHLRSRVVAELAGRGVPGNK